MESTTFKTNRLLLLLLVTGIGATLVAWQKQKTPTPRAIPKIETTDTVPDPKANRDRKIRNLDEALEDLDNVKVDVDMKKLNLELAKIGPEVQKAITAAGADMAKALKDIDMVKIKADIDASMAKIDWPNLKVQVDAAISNVDWDKMKVELDKIKDIQMDKLAPEMNKIDLELKKIKPELEKNLQNVKVEIEKAKKELKEYKSFIDGLDEDGLINKKENYSIRLKNGELIINGKAQPSGIYNKYKDFLEKHKHLHIEKSDDNFDIDND